ncbi:lipoyl(octanoyl) transferase LipB [Acinetobacter pollinis]|uniref:Octanoyltransferase n=1 Tax=Acinetobacter pollinis TaxID=2605270 RepID=A0ABU6DSC9_9GAMM|nr:lipoyl(octanoyl) transferase LipB [Acinetobacter pollinis]MEB5475818.1 lipoyl(octanoyl) transferase LipB [Acinetobacter pollinis]
MCESNIATSPLLKIRCFHEPKDYKHMFESMKNFTNERDETTPDEIWLLQHQEVLTQGQAGKAEHILVKSDVPIVQTDRGGQVTWHGPGQLVAYFLLDLNRLSWNVRTLVSFAENMMIELLSAYQIKAYAKPDAPGVYVDEKKIGSLGFKIRKGRSYHGFALNIDCQLERFLTINPCGYAGLEMTRVHNLVSSSPPSIDILYQDIISYLSNKVYFQNIHISHE